MAWFSFERCVERFYVLSVKHRSKIIYGVLGVAFGFGVADPF